MTIHSLGYQTDLFFPRFDSEVIDRGDYTVIRTPSNPTFHWGNFLLFEKAPVEGDLDRWQRLLAEEIGAHLEVKHQAFAWDDTAGEVGEARLFQEAGFKLNEDLVLLAKSVHRPAKYCDEAEVRPFTKDWEWQTALEHQVEFREEQYEEESYRIYATRKVKRYRAMAEAGLGNWFGAFLDGKLAGDLGLFTSDGVGRFQMVQTHPEFRRQGICGALVHQSALYALERQNVETLVMAADPGYHAAQIYESVGFIPSERLNGLFRNQE